MSCCDSVQQWQQCKYLARLFLGTGDTFLAWAPHSAAWGTHLACSWGALSTQRF